MSVESTNYDYIIAGSGMAGLSLAYRICRSEILDASILVIDRDLKTENDHTWCFWETGKSVFEGAVHRSWDRLHFRSGAFEDAFDIHPYHYKMIRSSEFYSIVNTELESNPKVSVLRSNISEVGDGFVETEAGRFEGFVFDSVTVPSYGDPNDHNLLQPFLGYFIRTEDHRFDLDQFTMFDFDVEQSNDCRFVYVLPISEHEALIEYTLFTGEIPTDDFMASELDNYIRENFGRFEILDREQGVIPMSDAKHNEFAGRRTRRIGMAGGYIKPSTGYSFQRTQRRLEKIVSRLEESKAEGVLPRRIEFGTPWKRFLDTVLLDVLENNRVPAKDVFTQLFERNGAIKMLRFLDEDTSFLEDIQVMSTVQLLPFSRSAIKEIAKSMFLRDNQ